MTENKTLNVTDPKTGEKLAIQIQPPTFEALNAAMMAMYEGDNRRANIAAAGRVLLEFCAVNKESGDFAKLKAKPAAEMTAALALGEEYISFWTSEIEEKKSDTSSTQNSTVTANAGV